MIYVMSDLHGCYKEYLKALEVIEFSEEDELFVLGDVVDRGENPILLLQDMMMRPNVFPILGNHDYMAMMVLKKLCVEINEENVESHLSENDMMSYYEWSKEGGDTTIAQFQKLSREEQMDILEYLEEFSLFEEVRVNNKDYVLVHAGLNHFDENKDLCEYDLLDLIFTSPDYHKVYYKDKYLVSGHTPTIAIHPRHKGEIVEMNNHIAIDCGCVFGLNLGVYCLDTQEKFYIAKM